jgi:hypothetical protein
VAVGAVRLKQGSALFQALGRIKRVPLLPAQPRAMGTSRQ